MMETNLNIYNYSNARDVDCQAKDCFKEAVKTIYIGMDNDAKCHFHFCEDHLKDFVNSLSQISLTVKKDLEQERPCQN